MTKSLIHIETLCTCHNRIEKTLLSLRDMYAQDLPDGVTVAHTIVDDGSIDGTFVTVKRLFPRVKVLRGDGSLFWAGGMRYGWDLLLRNTVFDYLFLYNNDVRLYADGIKRLLESSRKFSLNYPEKPHVVTATFVDQYLNFTYGGRNRSSKWHPLRFKLQEPSLYEDIFVDTLNMNACLMPRRSIQKVGFLSDFFVHGGADYEYGLKLKKAGGVTVLAPGIIGRCERNSLKGTSCEKGISLSERYRRLLSLKEQPVKQRYAYFKRHGGPLWPAIFCGPYFTLLFRHFARCKKTMLIYICRVFSKKNSAK